MFTRATGWVIVPVWLLAMGWLVAHDVLPAWTALEPPAALSHEELRGDQGNSQFSISDAEGPIGHIWTTHLVDENSIRRDDFIYVQRLPLDVAPLRLNVTSVFTGGGELDELTVLLENHEHRIRLHGERFDADFSFALDTGQGRPRSFKIPLTDGSTITGALSPFGRLPDLQVGQRWRVQALNPLTTIMPWGDRFLRMVVEVTGEETITQAGGSRKCKVVESSLMKAWVDADGMVLLQEVTLPALGKLTISREVEFDREQLNAMRQATMGMRKTQNPKPKTE